MATDPRPDPTDDIPAESPSRPEGADVHEPEQVRPGRSTLDPNDEVAPQGQLEIALKDALEERDGLRADLESHRARLLESDLRQVVQRYRLEHLQLITASFARALKPRDIAEVIVHEGTAAIGAPIGGIWLLDKGGRTLELIESTGLPAHVLERCSRVGLDSRVPEADCHRARSAVWIESRTAYAAAYPEAAQAAAESAEIAIVCLPLLVERHCFGAFSMAFRHARNFTDDERSFLMMLSHQAAQALDRARLIEEAERTEASLRFLCEASTVLAGSLDYDATLTAVARLAVPRIADWASIDMLEQDGTMRRVATEHADPAKVELGWELSGQRAPAVHDATGPGRVVSTGKPEVFERLSGALCGDAGSEAAGLRAHRSIGLISSMCIPLYVRGRPAGAMTLGSAESRPYFGASELALAEELGRRASLAIDNALAYREAQDANRVRDEFLATMSHELRTPLNAILGWAAMLRTRPDVDVKKAIGTIERNARAQVRLVEEVLDISRIMTGKLKLDLKSFDLTDILRACVDVVTPSALARGITLDASMAINQCPFYGDASRLQQVIWNLLSNAIKFTPKGGRVDVCLVRSGSEVELTVKDNGRGIRRDFLPVMFQRFRQADSSTTRTEGGLGVGLAIVSHLVELHGGKATAFSAGEGRGATLTVSLPVRAISMPEPQAASAAITSGKPLAGLRVLVCEDDADSRDLLHEVLSGEGATVRVAAAASEAIQHLREFRPDVLVSDIGLPLVDGYALMREIRELSADDGGRTPAIALTAYAGAEDARKAFSAGYQLHVAKPVEPSELSARVANLAGRACVTQGTR